MNKSLAILTALLFFTVGVSYQSISHGKKSEQTKATNQKQAIYTCTMHPEVTSDKPGKCPKCGMTLVLREEKDKATNDPQISSENSSPKEKIQQAQ